MSGEEKCEALAAYMRRKLHKDASSEYRRNGVTGSVEIDLIHPQQGVRIVAFSNDLIDDNSLDEIKWRLDKWGIVEALGEKAYRPTVVTNSGPRPYRGYPRQRDKSHQDAW